MEISATAATMRGPRGGASVEAGGRMAAPGQMAKAVVAEAREAGATVPSNAQGLAASAMARGQDAAALFALRVDTPPASDPGPDAAPVAEDIQPDAGDAPGATETPPTTEGAVLSADLSEAGEDTADRQA